MKRLTWTLVALVAVIAATGWVYPRWDAIGETGQGGVLDLTEGAALYAENCAACHGAALEGQPDWRTPGSDGVLPAPPHDETGHTWHHPDRVLLEYTLLGGKALMAQQGMEFNSGMPGFKDHLTEQQIRNVLGYIRDSWPDHIQKAQAERTKIDLEQGGN